ncbi:TetR/AcrR family transcriptional regulator [Janibacter limosus]|uniref:TetR/AcrR family transcriptional regulator n=1 Tax=Janibacter limosus TaxID=53458 RepID=UPI0008307166|nr:TetR/AcrR family transcriptional regulator [Janibacter limosus]
MTDSATIPRVGRSRRAAIIAAAQRLSISCGYSGFTVEDLASAVGVSRRTLFNHVSSKEEAVLGVLPVLTADQAETLRSGGPTGDLFEDLLVTTLQCLRSDEGDFEDWQQLHHVIERNPELVVRVKTHVDELAEEIVTHLSTRDGVDPTRARMALTLVAGIVQRSVEEIITDPTSGPLQQRIQTNLTLAREILTARG